MQKNNNKSLVLFLVCLELVFIGFLAKRILRVGAIDRFFCDECNVVLISLDILGAKHMPCYGYERNTAENLCRFGEENVFFEDAIANSPVSLPSHVSMFTGLYPSEHGVSNLRGKLDQKVGYLPRIMQENDYFTLFQIPRNDRAMLNRQAIGEMGVSRYRDYGESWDDVPGEIKEINREEGERVFAFLHSYDVHSPYILGEKEEVMYVDHEVEEIPDNLDEFYEVDEEIINCVLSRVGNIADKKICQSREGKCESFVESVEKKKSDFEALESFLREDSFLSSYIWGCFYDYNYYDSIDVSSEKHVEYIEALYDQEIFNLDQEIGEFLKKFEEFGLEKDTILIITSGHGEEFMEHGNISHSSLYEEVLRIPLMMYIPGVEKKKVELPVQGVDLMPTILDLVGLKHDYDVSGKSVKTLILGEGGRKWSSRALVGDEMQLKQRIVRKGKWKLFLGKDASAKYVPVELYNLEKDPEEQKNVLLDNYDIVRKLFER